MGKAIVYQILPRLWGNRRTEPVQNGSYAENGSGKFSDIDDATLAYLKDRLHVSHVWFTGVIRHATTLPFEGCPASNPQVVKGKAGSPYAIVDYCDVNPYLADNPENRMAEFKDLLKRTHDAGLKALVDFVPNHVSRDYGKVGMARPDALHQASASQDGSAAQFAQLGATDDCTVHWRPENDFYYYPGQPLCLPNRPQANPYYENPAKASGNCFSPFPGIGDWYETIRLNYCDFHTPTWDKMYGIVRFWCLEGVDGFRCDMVEMVPWQFFKWLIAKVKSEFPSVVFIAEVYSKDLYKHYIDEVGFDFLYDKSGLYDTLRAVVESRAPARAITWNWQFLDRLQPHMLNFLENHDEQRFASDFFGKDSSRAGAPLCASLMFGTAPYMIYFGEEVGERGMDAEGFSATDGRTTIFDWWSVASLRRLNEYVHTGKGLADKEMSALERYSEALATASLPAVSEGMSYDICYHNASSPGFDPERHFAFLRHVAGQTLLFVCNFSDRRMEAEIAIPSEAFAYFGEKKTEMSVGDISVEASGYLVLPV